MIALAGAMMLAVGSRQSVIWYVITAHIILMIGTPLAMSPAQTSALNSLEGAESADGSTILNNHWRLSDGSVHQLPDSGQGGDCRFSDYQIYWRRSL